MIITLYIYKYILYYYILLYSIILNSGKKRFPAHRLVLSASSEYFAAMFTSSLRESTQNEVELTGVDGDALWTLVCYCYTGIIICIKGFK